MNLPRLCRSLTATDLEYLFSEDQTSNVPLPSDSRGGFANFFSELERDEHGNSAGNRSQNNSRNYSKSDIEGLVRLDRCLAGFSHINDLNHAGLGNLGINLLCLDFGIE